MIYEDDHTPLEEKCSIEDLGKVVPEYVQGFNRAWNIYQDISLRDRKGLHEAFLDGKMLGIGIAKDDLLNKLEDAINKHLPVSCTGKYKQMVFQNIIKDILK
jgi:hypothetical protein